MTWLAILALESGLGRLRFDIANLLSCRKPADRLGGQCHCPISGEYLTVDRVLRLIGALDQGTSVGEHLASLETTSRRGMRPKSRTSWNLIG